MSYAKSYPASAHPIRVSSQARMPSSGVDGRRAADWCPQPLAFNALPSASLAEPPAAAITVDWKRYAGTWYELAAIPQAFEDGCVRSKAEYIVLSAPGGAGAIGPPVVSVRNTCILADGQQVDIVGVAQPVGPGRLFVDFGAATVPDSAAAGNYWVLEVGAGYEYALVGSPGGAWVLARSPNMNPDVVARLVARLRDVYGYNVDNIKTTAWGN